MNTSSSTSDSQKLSTDSVTKIQSPLGQRISQLIFGIFLVATLLLSIQAISPSLEFYLLQAATEIGADHVLSAVYVWGTFGVRNIIRLIFLGIGILIYVQKPYDRISLVTSVFLLCFGSGGTLYAQYVPDMSSYVATHNLLLMLPISNLGWLLLFLYFIYFPDGRPVPRIAQFHILATLLLTIPFSLPDDDPFYAFNWQPIFLFLTMLFMFGVPLASQVYRYRNISTPLQRQQTKWVIIGFIVAILSILFVATLVGAQPVGSINQMILATMGDGGFVTIPITLGFAIFRYRLWDVDLIINRSLAYVVVAGVAIGLFFVSLLGLQLFIGQTQPIVAFVITIICSIAVFQPLRQRVQRFVDRRIYNLRFEIDELRAQQQKYNITNSGVMSGKTLGNYQILDVVGTGGMGEVYKATDGTKTYAIKTLLASKNTDPEMISRFRREGEVGQRLTHPNIAGVYDIEQDSTTGTLYLVMDYLDGQDLSTVLEQEERLDLATTTRWICDLAMALDVAHADGLVHRDIKPSNVMIVDRDDAKHAVLMDFGVTKLKNANTLTGTGAIGTIGYMAPEQILDARTVDIYADIYALGVLTYEMLLGERPFTGGAGQVMFAHIQQPPPDPRDTDSSVPRSIAKAIMMALAKDPSERFSSAGAFADMLSANVDA